MHVVTVHDPFHPLRHREVRVVKNRRRICNLAPKTDKPFIAMVDGDIVLRKDWDRSVGGDQIVTFMMLPQGGGGGGSNPLNTVLLLAVLVAAPYLVGPAMLGLTGIAATIGTAAIVVGGSMLVNAIAPPVTASSMSNAATPAASPTYNIQAQGNAARLGQAIPVQYGRLRVFPDFAAQPYVEYANNEQYLYQLLCIGQGDYSIEAIQIADSAISSFNGVQYEVVLPGAVPTLFPANVVQSSEVSGQEFLSEAGTYSQTGTTITVTATAHGYTTGSNVYLNITSGAATSGVYTVATAPTLDTFTVTSTSRTTSGNVIVATSIGPFTVNAPTTVCKSIGIDVVCPRGLYYANDNGSLASKTAQFRVEARLVDQAGSPIGSWTTLTGDNAYTDWGNWNFYSWDWTHVPANTDTAQYQTASSDDGDYVITRTRTLVASSLISITGATTTPIRNSYKFDVSAISGGQTYPRFQVRAFRLDAKDTSTRAGHDIDWAGMRAYMPNTANYGNITLLAVRAQATNNLSSQSARQINVIATRKLKTVTATGLSSTTSATRSVAAALADAAMNTVYGGKLSSANIDWAALYALDQTLAARGDYLDVRFDTASTLWEALTQIGAVARTKPFMQGGILHVCRDQAATVPVALFSMRNIVQNSMSIQYMTATSMTADSVNVTYFDKNTWQQTTVSCVLAGGTSDNPAKISLLGVSERAQAFREGLYQAAANKYRRKVIKFSTEAEGFIPSFGDLIAIAHDMPAWGQTAEVTSWVSGTKTLTTNETLTWTAGATHYVGIRKRDGSIDGPFVATQGASPNVLVLATSPSFTPYTGLDEERTHIAFGPADTWRQPARVVSVVPRGPYQVEITAVNEDPSVHTADTGQTAPALKYSQLPITAPLPTVTGLTLAIDVTGATPQYVASWQAAPGAEHYAVEISFDGGTTWSAVATEYGTAHRWAANYNASASVRVAGVNIGRGAWVSASVNYSAAPASPTGFANTVSGNAVALTWSANVELDVVGYEIRTSDTGWGTAGAVFSGSATSTQAAAPAAGTPQTYYLRAIDFLGNYSAASATTTFTLGAPNAISSLAASVTGTQLQITWSKPASPISTQVPVAQFEVRTADTGWGTSSTAVFKGDALTFLAAPPAAGSSVTYYARAIDALGNYSSTSASVTFTSSAVTNIASFATSFYATSATSSTVTLSWSDVAPQYGLAGYVVSYGAVSKTVKSNGIMLPADWVGDRTITVKTVDLLGNISTGYSQTVTKQLPNSPTNFRAEVVDNTVMLFWGQPANTTLPISHYLIRRGTSWASYDVDFGRKDGLFTTINEAQGGTYTYWIATVDTDGNPSTAVSVTAKVSEPPDFTFYGQFNSTFSGTKSSAFLENGAVVMPVNTTETFASHFTSHSWAAPGDQVTAGFPVFIQPSSSPGYYEETFDFGTQLASSRVTIAYTASVIAGTPNMAVTISTSADGSTWVTNTGSAQIYATSFRYVKVRLTATDADGKGIFTLSAMSVTLDAKLKNDAGSTACASTDASGTVANFAREFIDVTSITLTPAGTTPVTAVYDFLDAVISGTYSITSNVCTVSATAHGLVVGQKVRLSFTSGTALSGVYTVASVVNANSYTVALTTANTSGNVSTYSQGMRIYLFNSSGTRVSGTASWSIKGY